MQQYKREIAFILSALVFCLFCALIIVFSVNSTPKEPQNEYGTYEIQYGLDTEITPETIVYEDEISDPVSEDMPEGVSYRKVMSRTIINTANGSRVILNYPRFTGLSHQKDIELNDLIRYYIEDMCRNTGEGMYKLAALGAKVMYELSDFKIGYIDGNFISIMFEGTYDTDFEGEPIDTGIHHFRYSLNIDLDKMDALSNEQLFADYIRFRSRLMDGKLILKHGDEKLLEHTTYASILSQYGDKHSIYPDLFFEKNTVNVIVSLSSDLGGCAVFSDTKTAGKEYINTYLAALSQYLT